jgi:transcriptional regulator with XRE-family HTH domain
MSRLLRNNVNLKSVADRVGLAPCSVSAVLNNTPASLSIPQVTRDKIFRAATELNYRPNLWAKSLRTKRTHIVAVLAKDLAQPAVAKVVAAAQQELRRRGYLLVLETLNPGDATHLPMHLKQIGVEGLIAIDATVGEEADLPVAVVDLSFVTSTQMIGNGINLWLQDLGSSAVETVIGNIETKLPRSANKPKVPPDNPKSQVEESRCTSEVGRRRREVETAEQLSKLTCRVMSSPAP